MNKTLSLSDVELTFDPATANIELRSHDPRLKAGVKLTVSADTPTYRSLLELLVETGHADLKTLELPDSTLRIEDTALLHVEGKHSRTHVPIGVRLGNLPLVLDLTKNTLIVGGAGSGKSIVARSIILSALTNDDVELWGIDAKRVELGSYAFREQDRLATTQEDALELLQALHAKLLARYALLEEKGVNHYLDLDTKVKSIYLVIDDVALVAMSEGSRTPEGRMQTARASMITEVLAELARLGRAAGVHLVLIAQRADAETVPASLRMWLSNRILMAKGSPMAAQALFGKPSEFGGAYLTPRGRGVLDLYGQQTLFQAYFVPHLEVTKPRQS